MGQVVDDSLATLKLIKTYSRFYFNGNSGNAVFKEGVMLYLMLYLIVMKWVYLI